MFRLYSLFPFLILACGCGMQQRTTEPNNLDIRLSTVEKSQRKTWSSDPDARTESLNHPDIPRYAQNVHHGSLNHRLQNGSISHQWSLMDLGEATTSEDAEIIPDLDGFWVEKEAKYLRRRPLPSFWETVKRDLEYMPKDIWRDTKRVYGNPINLAILGTAYGGSLALQQTGPDRTVEHHFRDPLGFGRGRVHRHMSSDWRDFFGAAGNPGTHFTLAGLWYLAGQQTMDDKTYEVGKTLFSALAINGLTVLVGQAATFDRSPNGERGTFPSGHTSSSFVFASVMHQAYGHVVGMPLYGLAALVAHERLESGEHYLSDVVMGAVLGTVVGHSVASGRDPEFFGWKVVPWASLDGGTGVAFMKTLK